VWFECISVQSKHVAQSQKAARRAHFGTSSAGKRRGRETTEGWSAEKKARVARRVIETKSEKEREAYRKRDGKKRERTRERDKKRHVTEAH
jgi:hypothetical protein